MPDTIAESLANTEIVGLTLWRTDDGQFQANLQSEIGGGWRVCIEPTKVEALRAVLRIVEPAPVLAPPPY